MSFDLTGQARAALSAGGDRELLAYGGTWRNGDWVRSTASAFDDALGSLPVVGLVARNRPHHVVLCAANIAARRSTAMLSSAQTPAGLAAEIRALALPAIVADRSDWSEEALVAAKEMGTLAVATLDEDPRAPSISVLAGSAPGRMFAPSGDTALELLSSGTTGAPKRVALSWSAIAGAVDQAGKAYTGSDSGAPQIMVHPLGNVAGLGYAVPPLVFSRPLVLLDRFTALTWAEAVRDYRPLRGTVPPAGIAMLLDSDVPADWLASLQLVAVGGGKLPASQHEAFETRFGIPVLPAYGATEFGGVVANWTLDDYRKLGRAKRGSAGRASSGAELRVCDVETGAVLPPGETGLLEVRAARIGDTWIRTTDLASIDADGFLFLEGRADGAINRGGFKIVPEALADSIRGFPGVREAVVVGIADSRLGEVPVAALEPEPGVSLDGESLLAWLRDRVPAYQVPVAVRVVEALPRNASMKIALGDVRALFAGS